MFGKVLVADRGDVAVRVMRTLEALGIATVAVHSEADAAAPHVRRAGEAHCIGPAGAVESHLRGERILETAARCGADAVHPGCGPLADSADFARACAAAGVTFIGPPAEVIEATSSGPALAERPIPGARHVEVQVLADSHGNVLHLGERACSVRLEHRTLVDESPAPGLDPALRERVLQAGVDAARAVGYRSAGAVEVLIADGEPHVLRLNCRGLLAHGVSEMVSAVDIVREQVLVAAGQPLSITQAGVWLRGHAIECRISAEDAFSDFAPAAGEITRYREPWGYFVRVDSGVEDGSTVWPGSDPTMARLIVWDRTRKSATLRMQRALDDYEIEGLETLLPFHRALLHTPEWEEAAVTVSVVETRGPRRGRWG